MGENTLPNVFMEELALVFTVLDACSIVCWRLYKLYQSTTAQLIYYLSHVSAATIQPSSGRMLFLDNEQHMIH
jgi:hypothetical protein